MHWICRVGVLAELECLLEVRVRETYVGEPEDWPGPGTFAMKHRWSWAPSRRSTVETVVFLYPEYLLGTGIFTMERRLFPILGTFAIERRWNCRVRVPGVLVLDGQGFRTLIRVATWQNLRIGRSVDSDLD